MERRLAIDIALDMVRRPMLTKAVQRAPLPEGVLEVIRIAADSETEVASTSQTSNRPPKEVREAAIFFLEQILFQPTADDYRTLGLRSGAGLQELQEHRRWLLKWLHPDRNHNSWESQFFKRVIRAADALDQKLKSETPIQVGSTTPLPHLPRRARVRRHRNASHRAKLPSSRSRPLRRVVYFVLTVAFIAVCWRLWNGQSIERAVTQLSAGSVGWLNW